MLIIVFIFYFLTFSQPRSDSVLAGFAAWHGNCESVQTGAFGGVPRPNGECGLGRCATLGRRTVVKSGTQALAGFNAHNVFHLQAVSWLEELDGGSELSRPLVQDRLSAAEHCSDTGGVQEENGALGSHTGSLRWGGLGSTFASHQRQSMI